jgi:hypothetical protein
MYKNWQIKNCIKQKHIGRTAGYATRRGVKPYVTRVYSLGEIEALNAQLKQGKKLKDIL